MTELLKSLSSGDLTKVGAYGAIFIFIWVEVRGLKTELANLNQTIAKSFAEGNARFSNVEHRLTLLENQNQGD